jgi:MFS-type transporter involved in bile tolerance (Atg22 family)
VNTLWYLALLMGFLYPILKKIFRSKETLWGYFAAWFIISIISLLASLIVSVLIPAYAITGSIAVIIELELVYSLLGILVAKFIVWLAKQI